jgi:hypothetical protein
MWVNEDVPSKEFHDQFPNHNEAHASLMEADAVDRPYTRIYFQNGECRCCGSYNLQKLRGLFV